MQNRLIFFIADLVFFRIRKNFILRDPNWRSKFSKIAKKQGIHFIYNSKLIYTPLICDCFLLVCFSWCHVVSFCVIFSYLGVLRLCKYVEVCPSSGISNAMEMLVTLRVGNHITWCRTKRLMINCFRWSGG